MKAFTKFVNAFVAEEGIRFTEKEVSAALICAAITGVCMVIVSAL